MIARLTGETRRSQQALALLGICLAVFGPALFIIWAGTR